MDYNIFTKCDGKPCTKDLMDFWKLVINGKSFQNLLKKFNFSITYQVLAVQHLNQRKKHKENQVDEQECREKDRSQIDKQTDRCVDRQEDGLRDRQTDGQAGKQADRLKKRQTIRWTD